jgi:RNA polymerase sigma factor for flagellar operon FliA
MIGIEEHLPLVEAAVASYSRRGVSPHLCEDLRSAGVVGLIDALARFKDTRGVPFSHYALIRIRGEMADELRRMDWLSRRSRARANAAGERPKSPFVSIDCRPTEDGDTIGERIKDESANLARDEIEARESVAALKGFVERLPERERTAVTLYYFGGMDLRAIGRRTGVSYQRVGQIIQSALRHLRRWLSVGPDALAA